MSAEDITLIQQNGRDECDNHFNTVGTIPCHAVLDFLIVQEDDVECQQEFDGGHEEEGREPPKNNDIRVDHHDGQEGNVLAVANGNDENRSPENRGYDLFRGYDLKTQPRFRGYVLFSGLRFLQLSDSTHGRLCLDRNGDRRARPQRAFK